MNMNVRFTVNGTDFIGTIYTNPFMFGRVEGIDVYDTKARRYVRKYIKMDERDKLFFTLNGKTVFVKEFVDHFECKVV